MRRVTFAVTAVALAVGCGEAMAPGLDKFSAGKLEKGSGSVSGIVYGGPPGFPEMLAIWDSSAFEQLAGAAVEVYWVAPYRSDSGTTPPPDTGTVPPPDTGSTPPPDTGSTPPDSGSVPPDSGSVPPDTLHPRPDTGYSPPDTGRPPSDTSAPNDTMVVGRSGGVPRWLANLLSSTTSESERILAGTATTDANGHFEIGDLPAGRYEIWVTPPTGAPYVAGLQAAFEQPDGFERSLSVILRRADR